MPGERLGGGGENAPPGEEAGLKPRPYVFHRLGPQEPPVTTT